jgi:hypothetical protein
LLKGNQQEGWHKLLEGNRVDESCLWLAGDWVIADGTLIQWAASIA